MPKRKIKKVNKLRGHRSNGRGNVKNRRGAGNRGGKGNAGMKKHKWTYVVKYEPDRYGNLGFVRQVKKNKMKTMNVWEIENSIKNGKLKKTGDMYSFDFKGKILGSGELSYPVNIKALKFTEKAIKKIESAGGKTHVLK